ncbi:MAG: hypothetical protein IPO83_08630 [Chitinophagaceae bacterium]|nr:hypothetical protein [Chitinophagaceae bacterium]
MKLYKKCLLTLLVTVPILIATTNSCDVITLTGTTYLFPTTNCTGGWRQAPYVNEDYTLCWIFTDGSYERTNAFISSAASSPNTSLPVTLYQSQSNAGEQLIQTTVSNRYGDDTDKKKVIGGSVPSTGTIPPMNTYTNSQAILNAPVITKIQTDHGNDEVAKDAPLLLILTVNNDHIENNDALGYQLQGEGYVLRLYHKNVGISYGFTAGQTTNYPSQLDEYFAFAPLNSPQIPYNVGFSMIRLEAGQ